MDTVLNFVGGPFGTVAALRVGTDIGTFNVAIGKRLPVCSGLRRYEYGYGRLLKNTRCIARSVS